VSAEEKPLRLRRRLTHAPSEVIAALEQQIRADLMNRGWPEDRAADWASRAIANPELRWVYSTPGLDPHEEAS
jgi:hypothetical protein